MGHARQLAGPLSCPSRPRGTARLGSAAAQADRPAIWPRPHHAPLSLSLSPTAASSFSSVGTCKSAPAATIAGRRASSRHGLHRPPLPKKPCHLKPPRQAARPSPHLPGSHCSTTRERRVPARAVAAAANAARRQPDAPANANRLCKIPHAQTLGHITTHPEHPLPSILAGYGAGAGARAEPAAIDGEPGELRAVAFLPALQPAGGRRVLARPTCTGAEAPLPCLHARASRARSSDVRIVSRKEKVTLRNNPCIYSFFPPLLRTVL